MRPEAIPRGYPQEAHDVRSDCSAFQSDNLTADIVAAFVAYNSLPRAELPALIQAVHAALVATISGSTNSPNPAYSDEATVSAPKPITQGYLVCLEDGQKFKSMRRHLTALGLTPELYRAKWNLPVDFPMVAPNYAARRSALARQIGLGHRR